MNFEYEKQRLVGLGFTGFTTISELVANIDVVPQLPGVYVVMRNNANQPEFLTQGTGGFFKEKNPNVSIDELKRNWVDDTSVLYIGKAGSLKGSATLRSRLRQYMQFGQGKAVGHYGGQYIWQLQDAKDLVVCWKVTLDDEPRVVEKQMIEEFKAAHGGKRPFANLVD